ncbi:MAG: hypothetical protein A3H97_25005 [Acidobacteria bacterium RIFCSPLOWO2_02_FULL_65_29]|nr:MAG: hypothetical protein A3H97_25005 [Acidobacteria bacterium RIFCSPLOWO2_02_FULL_65_29]
MDTSVRTLPAEPPEDTVARPPRPWQRLGSRYPSVVAAYDVLSEACRDAGPLDESAVALVKLAISIGAGADRTVHIHCKKALRAGVDPDALRQVALIALPTIGLPASLDALRWVDETIQETLGSPLRP